MPAAGADELCSRCQAELAADSQVVPADVLARELTLVVKAGGLPLDLTRAGPILLGLRSVIARSIHPSEPISRLDALNELLVKLLVDMGDEGFGPAARVLFAIARGTRSTSLTYRRAESASLLALDPDHFRKRVEPKIILEVATLVHRDLLRYKGRVRRAPASLEPTGDTPSLSADDFTHQEELVSRIWQHVYGLRAELIAAGRRDGKDELALEAEEHRQEAALQAERLQGLIQDYLSTYGERLIRHGGNEFDVEGVRRLVGWRIVNTS